MSDEKQRVTICSVAISYPHMSTYHATMILPDASEEDLKKLIISEFVSSYPVRKDHDKVDEDMVKVELTIDDHKTVNPLFKFERFCRSCGISASEAGVENDMFFICGHCGRPSSVRLRDPE